MLSHAAILAKIGRQPRRSARFKQLVHELGLRGDDRRLLAQHLHDLVARGQLLQPEDDLYTLPSAASARNLVTGRLSMHRDGYGFVTPESEELRQRLDGDIFVNPGAVGTAMHGDRVLIEMGNVRGDRRAEGRILRVVNRAHATVVGIFHYGRQGNYVRPIDEKITQDIHIPPGQEHPPASPASPQADPLRPRHRVIGSEARRREVPWDDLEGVAVDVEITSWPSPTQSPRGRVVEILGYEDDFGVDVEIMIRKFHLPHRFPAGVIEEAQSIENVIAQRELRARRDYRHLPIVTIDGETARDFDDAVLVRLLDNGNFELQVHIADVAHYVGEGSALDEEARRRGTSVYFPDRAVPMLPVELSTDICSLRPKLDRLVMSCVMEIDHRGEVLGFELTPGIIRSVERMTYTDVNLVLENDPGLRQRYRELASHFDRMAELARILNRKRERRGSIDFDLPEPVIEFDENGLMKGITRSERNLAHRLIEEFMLAANECVASYLEHKGVPSLYRIHEKPEPKRVYDFETIAATFGYSLGVGALPVQRMQMKTDRRAGYGSGRRPPPLELPQEVHITPRMYQKLAKKIAGKPEERILSYLMLRSLKQARYSQENEGHFALAAPTYTHFTSPIRRYPDLIVHRILKHVLSHSPEDRQGGVPLGRAQPAAAGHAPWSKRSAETGDAGDHGLPRKQRGAPRRPEADAAPAGGGIPLEVLRQIAEESSNAERRADDAERELMEWKKAKFMHDRIGDEFEGLVVSVTKYGLFVELTDMFVEGLVPLATLTDDRYTYHENTRQIIGQRSRKTYSMGDRVRVLVDRIDPVQKKIQFALVEPEPRKGRHAGGGKRRRAS
jgi:ribonuclease R